MSVRRAIVSTLVTVVGGSVLAVLPAPVHADADLPSLGSALDLPAGVTISLSGSAAVTSQEFDDFPSRGSEYVVLSTGDAQQVILPAPLALDDPATPVDERDPDVDAMSTDRGADGVPDTTRLTLSVDPSTEAGCLHIDFAMATDETVRVPSPRGDRVSVTRRAAPGTEYALNAGRGYFSWTGWAAQPRPYTVNDIDYWHEPGDRSDVLNGQLETPRLQRWTRLNNVTTRDTARVPLDFSNGADTVDVDVADGAEDNGEIDSAALVDAVRLTPSCSSGSAAQPSRSYGEGSIKGERRVGYPLSYDPIPATPEIDRYDGEDGNPATAPDNGWTYPGKTALADLRFRWYRTKQQCPPGGLYTEDMNQWFAIPDADRQSYVPSNLDRGRCLIVLVSGVVDGRPTLTFPRPDEAIASPVKWYETLPIDYGVFQEGATPVVHGIPKVGEKLTVSPVTTRPLQDSWSYQWFADGASISGATSESLVLGAAQRTKVITVRATATRSSFDSKPFTSAPTPKVAGNQMESTGNPVISPQPDGLSPAVGDQLVADPGSGWPENTSYTYQWKRGGSPIAGADESTYETVPTDAGKLLSVVVGGSKPGFDPVTAESPAVTVSGATMQGAVPTISGIAKVGSKLTGSADGWLPAYSSYTYSWYAGGRLLQTSSSRYYTVAAAAVGQPIVLEVKGVKSGYEPLTRKSAPTAAVKKGTITAGTVRLYGTASVGSTLRISPGSWKPAGVTFKYQWRIGTTWLSGTTRTSVRLPSSARGKRVTVYVTGSKSGYNAVKKSVVSSVVR